MTAKGFRNGAYVLVTRATILLGCFRLPATTGIRLIGYVSTANRPTDRLARYRAENSLTYAACVTGQGPFSKPPGRDAPNCTTFLQDVMPQ